MPLPNLFHLKLKRGSRAAFTLVELLIVLMIMGLLATVVMATLSQVRAKGRDSKRVQDVRTLQEALAMYLDNEDRYPIVAVAAPGIALTGADAVSLILKNTGILPISVTDPLSGQDGFSYPLDYYYRTDAQGASYTLTFCLETSSMPGRLQGCANFASD